MRLEIVVTEADIDCGIGAAPDSCPIALAGARALEAAGYRGWWLTWQPHSLRDGEGGLTVWAPGSERHGRPTCRIAASEVDARAAAFADEFDDWYAEEEDDAQSLDRPAPIRFEVDLPLPA